ncbi:hypothetical protein RI367_008032 [Sorochytrium milnesiophthora]
MAFSSPQTVSVERESSQLTAVTVYSDRAELTRLLKGVEIATEGQTTVKLLNVSKDIDADSIRVEGSGDAKILDVSYEVAYEKVDAETEKATQAQKLQKQREKELEGLNVTLEREQLALEHLETRDGIVQQYADNCAGVTSASRQVPADSASATTPSALLLTPDAFFKSFLGEYTKVKADLGSERLATKQRIKALEKEIAQLRELIDLNRYAGNDGDSTKQINAVCVIVEAENDAEYEAGDKRKAAASSTITIDLSVTYVVMHSAQWTPLYDARMYSDEGVLKLTYHANVVQNTGEDWTGCKLTLSTAAVDNLSGEAPEFDQAWSVTKIDPRIDRRSGNVTAEARAGLISANYVIPGLTNIPSDNNAHKVSVALIDFTPKLEYVAVPKKAEKAYLMAKIVNDSPYTLLAGACSVFLNHSFVSKSQLPLVLPKSTFSTSLGVDPAVKVSYRPAHSTHSTNAGGLLYKATNMDKFDRRIVIHNRRVTPITIRVVDQLPTSRTDDVLVKLVEPKQSDIITFDSRVERDKALDAHDESEQKPGEERLPLYTADVGTIEWHLNVPDNQTREVNLQFSVMYPKDVRVEGLAD